MKKFWFILLLMIYLVLFASCERTEESRKIVASWEQVRTPSFKVSYQLKIDNFEDLKNVKMTAKLKEGRGFLFEVFGEKKWDIEDLFLVQKSITKDTYTFCYQVNSEDWKAPFAFDVLVEARGKEPIVFSIDATQPLVFSVDQHYSTVGRKKRLRFALDDETDPFERYLTEYPGIKFSSDDESVATIDDRGFFTAHRVGKTILRAEGNGQRVETPLEVIDYKCVTHFTYTVNGELFDSRENDTVFVKKGTDKIRIEGVEIFPKNTDLWWVARDGDFLSFDERNLGNDSFNDGFYYLISYVGSLFNLDELLIDREFKNVPQLNDQQKILAQACVDEAFFTYDYGQERWIYGVGFGLWVKLVD